MQSNRKSSKKQRTHESKPLNESECFEGERLDRLLKSIRRGIESARLSDGESLPEKIWLKKQFAIGVNEVTRVLERMQPCFDAGNSPQDPNLFRINPRGGPSVKLQAILLAADCNPRMLTKHLLGLAVSRNVPIVCVREKKQGSLRLGELVKLKTALAIGIKAKGNAINQIVEEALRGDDRNVESEHIPSLEIPGAPNAEVEERERERENIRVEAGR